MALALPEDVLFFRAGFDQQNIAITLHIAAQSGPVDIAGEMVGNPLQPASVASEGFGKIGQAGETALIILSQLGAPWFQDWGREAAASARWPWQQTKALGLRGKALFLWRRLFWCERKTRRGTR